MKKKIGEYIFDSQLGSGQYGEVFKVFKEGTNEIYAIKSIPKVNIPSKVKTYLDREVNILQLINHPNVIRLIDLKMSDNHYYIVMEYCNGQDLGAYKKKYKNIPEKTVRNFSRQLVSGIAAIHKAQAIHRDIKLANIMLHYEKEGDRLNENPIIKIGDFGFARLIEMSKEGNETRLDASREMSFVGTPLNMAPELLHKNKYSSKADFWSLGTCIYELLIGRVPFRGVDKADLTKHIDKGLIPFPKEIKLSMECMDFILKCLKYDKKMRIDLEELTKHEFITTDKCTDFDYMIFKKLNPTLAKLPESSHPEINYFLNNINYIFVPEESKDKTKLGKISTSNNPISSNQAQEEVKDLIFKDIKEDSNPFKDLKYNLNGKVNENKNLNDFECKKGNENENVNVNINDTEKESEEGKALVKAKNKGKGNGKVKEDKEDSSSEGSIEEEIKIIALAKDHQDYKTEEKKSHYEIINTESKILKIEEDYVKLNNESSPDTKAKLIDKIEIDDNHFCS